MKLTQGQIEMQQKIKRLEDLYEQRGIENYGVQGWEKRKQEKKKRREEFKIKRFGKLRK